MRLLNWVLLRGRRAARLLPFQVDAHLPCPAFQVLPSQSADGCYQHSWATYTYVQTCGTLHVFRYDALSISSAAAIYLKQATYTQSLVHVAA